MIAPGAVSRPAVAEAGHVLRISWRLSGAALVVALLMIVDRWLFATAETLIAPMLVCPVYPRLGDACVDQMASSTNRLLSFSFLVVLIVALGVLWTWARRWVATPLLTLLAAGLILALSIDLGTGASATTINSAALVFLAVSLLAVVGSVGGLAFVPELTLAALGVATLTYALGFGMRFASFQVVVGLWPVLGDASRLYVLYIGAVVANGLFACLALIGPSAFADWRRHLG